MDVMKLKTLSVALMLVMALSGCGTFMGRVDPSGNESDGDYYISARTDLRTLGFAEGGNKAMFPCLLTLICPVVVAFSIPVDAVVDTLMIPRDYIYADQDKILTFEQAKAQAGLGSIAFDFNKSIYLPEPQKNLSYSVMYTHVTRRQYIFLRVNEVPLADGVAVAYIPRFVDYVPYNLDIKYSTSPFKIVDVYFERFGRSLSEQNPQYQNNTTFISYDGEKESGQDSSQVAITPSIKNLVEPVFQLKAWSASARTH